MSEENSEIEVPYNSEHESIPKIEDDVEEPQDSDHNDIVVSKTENNTDSEYQPYYTDENERTEHSTQVSPKGKSVQFQTVDDAENEIYVDDASSEAGNRFK